MIALFTRNGKKIAVVGEKVTSFYYDCALNVTVIKLSHGYVEVDNSFEEVLEKFFKFI